MVWYLKKRLISEKQWKKEIGKLKAKKVMDDKDKIRKLLKEKLISAVGKSLPKEKFGILFSGGIDSTLIALICKRLKKDFICYSVGLENSQDLASAKKVAKAANKLREKMGMY